MIGEDFMFGKHWLSEFDMIMCSPDEAQEFVTRNISRGEITPNRPEPNHYSVSYSDTLVLNFFILRDDTICETQKDMRLTGDDLHYLRAWLESPKKPTELIMPLNEDEMTVHYFGVFTSVQPYLFNDECYGLELTFTCNAPYGYSDEKITTFNINSTSVAVSGICLNLSAEYENYLKPVIKITSVDTFGSGETLTITNETDNSNEMSLTMPEGLSGFIIDCEKRIVTDLSGNLLTLSDVGLNTPESSSYNFVSASLYRFYWLSLAPNANKLTFTPSQTNTIGKVYISTKYIMKAGGF